MFDSRQASNLTKRRTGMTGTKENRKSSSILCVFMVLLIVFINVTGVLAADSNVDFTISNTQAEVNGETIVTLTIGTANWVNVVNGIAAFNIKVDYDGNAFEYVSTEVTPESKIIIGSDEFTAVAVSNVLRILYMDQNFKTPIPEQGSILKAKFKVKTTAATGGYKFKLYGDNVIVDGQLPKFNSIPVYYPNASTVFIITDNPAVTPTPTTPATSTGSAVSGTTSGTPTLTPAVSSSSDTSTIESTNTDTTPTIEPSPPIDYTNTIKNITERIEALPEKITVDRAGEVKAIIKDYDKLPAAEKQKVVNYDKLEKANSVVNALTAERNKLLFTRIGIPAMVLVLIAIAVVLMIRIRKRRS
jgi:hypothetical protein